MAGISQKTYKTKNGIVTKYTITYRDMYGIQRTSGLYDTEREASIHLPEFEDAKTKSGGNILFSNIVELYMNKVRRKYADNTINAYEGYVKNYLKKFLDLKYKKLDVEILQEHFDTIEKVKPFMAYNVLKFCKSACNYAIRKKRIKDNIFNQIDNIILPDPDKKHFSFSQILELLKTCTSLKNSFFPILLTFVLCGLREGELLALEKKDFNFETGVISINKQYTGNKLKHKTKTDKSRRDVFMIPIFTFFMNEIYMSNLTNDTTLVFANKSGKYINPSNIRQRCWQPLLVSSGYPYNYSTLHDLRGFYIDFLFFIGVNGKFTQNQVGHSNYGPTYNIYAQNSSDIVVASRNRISETFGMKGENYDLLKPEIIREKFRELFILYVQNNNTENKHLFIEKINNFFYEEKCENFVRIKEETDKNNVIKFPKPYKEVN